MILHYSIAFGCDGIDAASGIRCADSLVLNQSSSLDLTKSIKFLTSMGWRVYTNHNGELRTKCPQCRAKHPPDPESPFKQPRDDT
jgi:hypothetical protein